MQRSSLVGSKTRAWESGPIMKGSLTNDAHLATGANLFLVAQQEYEQNCSGKLAIDTMIGERLVGVGVGIPFCL